MIYNSRIEVRENKALFGSKPSVPRLSTTTLGESQQQAIKDNKAAEAGAAEQATFTKDQIMSMLGSVIPGFEGMRTKAASNIGAELNGQLPADVVDLSRNKSVAGALGRGFAGSGAADDLVARDLGLNTLALSEKGLTDLESWQTSTERMLSPAIARFDSMFVSPMDEYKTTNEQNLQQFQRSWMKNQISAMPDPVVRGIQDTVMQLSGRGNGPQQQNYGAMGSPGSKISTSDYQYDPYGWGEGSRDVMGTPYSSGSADMTGFNGGGMGDAAGELTI